jgi:hypothetical protein
VTGTKEIRADADIQLRRSIYSAITITRTSITAEAARSA